MRLFTLAVSTTEIDRRTSGAARVAQFGDLRGVPIKGLTGSRDFSGGVYDTRRAPAEVGVDLCCRRRPQILAPLGASLLDLDQGLAREFAFLYRG
jgi:hypothetical protein